jgi:hypothetical protein
MYDKSKWQFARTIPNHPLTPRPNGYNQPLDTLSAIMAPGYFPAYFDATPGLVLVNDSVTAISSTGINFGTITSVSPTVTINWMF